MNQFQTIELSPIDAEYFVKFQQYYQQFSKIIEDDVFDKGFTGQVVLDIFQGNIGHKRISFDKKYQQ